MLMGYEEAKWAGALDYLKQDADESLEIIRLARLTTYNILKTLPDEVFTHSAIHPEHSYVGTSTGQIFFSRDAGDHWELLADYLPPVLSVETAIL